MQKKGTSSISREEGKALRFVQGGRRKRVLQISGADRNILKGKNRRYLDEVERQMDKVNKGRSVGRVSSELGEEKQ